MSHRRALVSSESMFRALPILILVLAAARAAGAQPAGTPAHAATSFMAAKMAVLEGSFDEALALFEDAIEADGADPYLRVEFAETLLRAAAGAEAPNRAALLARAAAQAEAASRLAPGNLDALRLLAQVRLAAAQSDPEAKPLALQALAALHAASPESPAALSYARLLIEEDRASDAVAVLRETLRRQLSGQRAEGLRDGSLDRRQSRAVAGLLVEALRQAGWAGRDDSAGILREILAADPTLLEARLGLAEVEMQRGEARAALDVLEAAPPAQQRLPELRVQLALAQLRAGQFDAALEGLDETILTPRQAALLRATVLDARGDFRAAAAALSGWVAEHPDDIEASATQARVLYRLGRADEAEALMSQLEARVLAAEGAERAGWVRLRAALLAATFERWDAVDRATASLVGPPPALPEQSLELEALVLRADALVELDRLAEAVRLLEAEEGTPIVEGKRAEVLAAMGKEREAVRRLNRLGSKGDESALVAIEAFQRLERHREALRLADQLLAKEPDSIAAQFRRGASLERLGRTAEAEQAFRALLVRAPGFAPALNYLGYMLAERGEKSAEALLLTRRAVALDPASGAYADSLGWASYRNGDLVSARRELERASRLEPDATVFEHLGDVLAALGERSAARAAYDRAADLGPEKPQVLRRKIESLDSGIAPAPPR
jgi:tetratricopeptide (TPR) repeat protein